MKVIKEIYKKLKEYLVDQEDVALEIRMHPFVYGECLNCDYQEVITAFNMTPSLPNAMAMFNYRLVIDSDLDESEYLIQTPRVKR